MEKEKIKCNECELLFRDRYNLWRHQKRKHHPVKIKVDTPKAEKPKPTCSLCGQIFYKNGNLKRHGKFCKKARPSSAEEYIFNNENEFEEWKKNVEEETKARFVRKSCYKLNNGSFRTKYCCHRSGYFKPRGKNLRRTKILGSNKINAICPSKIIAIVNTDSKVEVSFFSQHSGHSMELERITLSKNERAEIADMLAQKIPFKEILNNIKRSASESDLRRIHLLTIKDLRNIEKEFRLNSSMVFTHEEEAVQGFQDVAPNEIISSSNMPMRFTSNIEDISPIDQIDPEPFLPPLPGTSLQTIHPGKVSLLCHTDEASQVSIPTIVTVPAPDVITSGDLFVQRTQEGNQYCIEKIKEEMRKEFELVLSSIENVEQAQNAKKWIFSFHSFVHCAQFPLTVVSEENVVKVIPGMSSDLHNKITATNCNLQSL